MIPFERHSVSLRMYPHALPASGIVDELRTQAALAVASGFDGVMVSEHHGGFAGYLPDPLQQAGWALEAMPRGWAAACPLLLPLRPAALVAEEVAWLAARFPGRVGFGVAAGALQLDFDIAQVPMEGLTARFRDGLAVVAGLLSGREPGLLAGDQAIARCAEHPVPVLSAAMSPAAVRRAAEHGVGIVMDSLSTVGRVRELTDAYRAAGGTASCVLVRRVWLGDPPRDEVARQVDVYRSYASSAAMSHWGEDEEMLTSHDRDALARAVADVMRAGGADALNLRIHVPGVGPEQARDQIERLGREVLPVLRAELEADMDRSRA